MMQNWLRLGERRKYFFSFFFSKEKRGSLELIVSHARVLKGKRKYHHRVRVNHTCIRRSLFDLCNIITALLWLIPFLRINIRTFTNVWKRYRAKRVKGIKVLMTKHEMQSILFARNFVIDVKHFVLTCYYCVLYKMDCRISNAIAFVNIIDWRGQGLSPYN
jgi:hypothetical protein